MASSPGSKRRRRPASAPEVRSPRARQNVAKKPTALLGETFIWSAGDCTTASPNQVRCDVIIEPASRTAVEPESSSALTLARHLGIQGVPQDLLSRIREWYPELAPWRDSHLLDAWSNYSRDAYELSADFGDPPARDDSFLAYLYILQLSTRTVVESWIRGECRESRLTTNHVLSFPRGSRSMNFRSFLAAKFWGPAYDSGVSSKLVVRVAALLLLSACDSPPTSSHSRQAGSTVRTQRSEAARSSGLRLIPLCTEQILSGEALTRTLHTFHVRAQFVFDAPLTGDYHVVLIDVTCDVDEGNCDGTRTLPEDLAKGTYNDDTIQLWTGRIVRWKSGGTIIKGGLAFPNEIHVSEGGEAHAVEDGRRLASTRCDTTPTVQ